MNSNLSMDSILQASIEVHERLTVLIRLAISCVEGKRSSDGIVIAITVFIFNNICTHSFATIIFKKNKRQRYAL